MNQPYTTPLKAAIYVRVSGEKQKEGYSLSSQEEYCLEYCKERSYRVKSQHIYHEVMTGVIYRERPVLNALRDAARRGEFDVVIVYELDRLAREDTHQTVIMEDLRHHGVRLETVKMEIEDTPVGRYMVHTYGFMAEVEREKILERTERGRLKKIREGNLIGSGRPLYGYSWVKASGAKTATYEINPDEAEIVERIFSMCLGGCPIREIARTLDADNVPTRTGGQWRPSTIRQILANPFYIGKAVVYKERLVHDYEDGRNKRIRVKRPEEERYVLPDGIVPVIIDTAIFEKAQRRLTLNKLQAERNNPHPEASLLRGGFALCGYCGSVMRANSRGIKRPGQYYYCCPRALDGRKDCQAFSIACHLMDEIVWEHALEIIRNPRLVAQKVEEHRRQNRAALELAPIDDRLAKLARQQKNYEKLLDQLMAEDDAEDTEDSEDNTESTEDSEDTEDAVIGSIVHKLNKIAKDQRTLESERKKIISECEGWEKTQTRLDEFAERCKLLAQDVEQATYKDKRDALEFLGILVRIWKLGHEPRYEITSAPPDIVSVSS